MEYITTTKPQSAKSLRYALYGLALTSATASAVAAYPAAASLAGEFTGGVFVSLVTAASLAGWHIATDARHDTDTRILSGLSALAASVIMVLGIHTSANLNISTAANTAALAADNLYTQQEQARINTLNALTEELRATQKSKYPAEYARLQNQIDELRAPTQRQATAEQITNGVKHVSDVYAWGRAVMFELFAPLFLFFGNVTGRKQASASVRYPSDDRQIASASVRYPSDDPLTALQERRVLTNDDGYITIQAVMQITGCSERQARTAIAKAADGGVLERVNNGGTTRYCYAKTILRSVK